MNLRLAGLLPAPQFRQCRSPAPNALVPTGRVRATAPSKPGSRKSRARVSGSDTPGLELILEVSCFQPFIDHAPGHVNVFAQRAERVSAQEQAVEKGRLPVRSQRIEIISRGHDGSRPAKRHCSPVCARGSRVFSNMALPRDSKEPDKCPASSPNQPASLPPGINPN